LPRIKKPRKGRERKKEEKRFPTKGTMHPKGRTLAGKNGGGGYSILKKKGTNIHLQKSFFSFEGFFIIN